MMTTTNPGMGDGKFVPPSQQQTTGGQIGAFNQNIPVGATAPGTGMPVPPTVGRMVYYKSRGSADGKFPPTNRAAVITDVCEHKGVGDGTMTEILVRLCVLNPEGIFFSDWLSQGQEPGEWDWMPFQKDQMARLAPGTANASHPAA